IHGMNLLGLKANRDVINPAYARYFFYSLFFREQLGRITKKSVNQASFTVADLKKIKVLTPSLEKQAEIVNTLNRINNLISKRKDELQMFDDLIKARFVEMFGTVDDNVFDYPVVRLGDYAKLQGGYAFKSKDFVTDGIPLVQIGNVNKDYLDWEVINAVPEAYLDRYREFSLCDGDLVMAMTRPIIKSLNSVKVAKVSKRDVPCLLNQRVGRFVLSDSLDKLFLETLCKSDDFKDYVEKMSGNSLQPNISSKQVEDYMIILPPIDLQERFAVFVNQVDKSKVVVQKALDKAQLLFDSLMQKYFG
ncbi:MAG: restriction endonuclease subunit S, partial [Clostridia bacterium]|nr:restriction endonuclease subunit S [Clostridia bacterium]